MARYWAEKLDIATWRDIHGGKGRTYSGKKIDNLVCPETFFIEVCNFTFGFSDLNELNEYIEYFSTKTHHSTRTKLESNEDHYDAQTKFTRLPAGLVSNHKRPKVLKALQKGVNEFFSK